MGNLDSILNGPWVADNVKSPYEQIKDLMSSLGIDPPDSIIMDGNIHRFRPDKSKDGESGWYIFFNDNISAGRFGDWRTGTDQTWVANIGRELSPAEIMQNSMRMAEAKKRHDEERAIKNARAADTARVIWENAGMASEDYPYMQRKGIKSHCARMAGDGRLVLPLYNAEGELSTIQYIDREGNKLYHPGGATKGCFQILGVPENKIFLAEGFATAATIYETTGISTAIAYSAGNLVPVAGILREKYPAASLVIVADNDQSGTGKNYADQAAAKYGATVIMPPDIGDANDFKQAGGDLLALLVGEKTAYDRKKVVFGDELPSEWEAPDEIIEGLITANSMTVIYGDSNSGKTFLAVSMASALSCGDDFFGRKTDPGIVLYLATESPGSIRSRMQAIKKHMGKNLDCFAMVPVPVNFYTNQSDAVDIIEIAKHIEKTKGKKVSMIVADTLARVSAGANENSGEDMGPVMARFDIVKEATGAAVVIIHHCGKDTAKGARGWSGIRAHVDTEIEVSEKDGSRVAVITKQRELATKNTEIFFKLEVVEMGISKFGDVSTTCVAVADDGESAKESKKNKKLEVPMKSIDGAWWDSGSEIVDGSPYVSKAAWMRHMVEREGKGEASARQYVKPAAEGKPANILICAGIIAEHGAGYIIIDGSFASKLLLARG